MRTTLMIVMLSSLISMEAGAFESGCVRNGEPCLAGAPTARAGWSGGPAGRANAAEHARLFDVIFDQSGVPAAAAAPLRWTQYSTGAPVRLVSPTTCKLPDPERSTGDYFRALSNAFFGAVVDPVGAFREAVEDVERTITGLLVGFTGGTRCPQGACKPSPDYGAGVGVCVWEGPSLQPTAFATVEHMTQRSRTPAELTQLPDYGWSLHDLLTGFEECPVDIASAADCHTFSRHMGAYNSSHFPPQSQDFFAHYHQLALDRAAACQLEFSMVPADARFARFRTTCLGEAMAYEAIAQHFLHDTWSVGHTWQRWGAPEPSRSVPYAEAHLVALAAGIIHGTKSVICFDRFCPDDALNAPTAGVALHSAMDSHAAVGDLYLDALLNDAAYASQRDQLFACATSALRSVYTAAGEPLGPLTPAGVSGADIDPISDACFGQRATNRAMLIGAGISGRVGDVELNLSLGDLVVQRMVVEASAVKRGAAGDLSDAAQRRLTRRFHRDMILLSVKLARGVWAPDETDLADGGLPPILGATVNGENRVEGVPASYVDVLTDADPRESADADAERKHALHASYAADWCQAFDGSRADYDLERLRDRVEQTHDDRDFTDSASVERARVACSVCVDFAERHVRVGAGPDAYDVDREPLCHYLAPDVAQIVYVPEEVCFATLPPELVRSPAEQYCGCRDPRRQRGFALVSVARSTGDPHLTTLDGLAYDFQAAGEYLLVERGAGVVVQARQEPATDSVCPSVSVNTAISARIGGSRVSVFVDDARMWIDGVAQPLDAPVVFDDCSQVFPTPSGYGFVWASGEQMVIHRRETRFDLDFAPAAEHAGAYSGLLGDFDGDPLNDLRDAAGTVIPTEPLAEADVYTRLRTAWLAIDHGRLFEERPEEGPGAFDRDDFPARADGVEAFTEDEVAAAGAICADAGVVDGHRLKECALDVLCLGPDAAPAFAGQAEPAAVAEVSLYADVDDDDCALLGGSVVGPNPQPRRARVNCVAGCEESGSVWGTDIYTDDSRVCRAAIHAGRLAIGEAGPVWIEYRPGQDSYLGSERNGVQSSDWGEWGRSFVFIDAP